MEPPPPPAEKKPKEKKKPKLEKAEKKTDKVGASLFGMGPDIRFAVYPALLQLLDRITDILPKPCI